MLQMSLNDWIILTIIILFLILWKHHHLTSFSLSVRTLISSSYLSSFSEYWWQTERQRNSISSHLVFTSKRAHNGSTKRHHPRIIIALRAHGATPSLARNRKGVGLSWEQVLLLRGLFQRKAMPYLLKKSCHEVNLSWGKPGMPLHCMSVHGREWSRHISECGRFLLAAYIHTWNTLRSH